MSTTGFTGHFEDDRTGFQPKDRARIIYGIDAGKFAIIQSEVVPGYYHVRLEKDGTDRVLDYSELEPLIRPVMVEGGLVIDTPVTADVLTEEVVETVIRLANQIKVDPPVPVKDETERARLEDLLVAIDDVIIEAVRTEVILRRGIATLAQNGAA